MKKSIYRVLIVMLFIMLLTLLSISFFQHKYSSKAAYQLYTVRPGDTLWGIAKEYEQDPRELIYEIRKINNITPEIYPGQELKIPVR